MASTLWRPRPLSSLARSLGSCGRRHLHRASKSRYLLPAPLVWPPTRANPQEVTGGPERRRGRAASGASRSETRVMRRSSVVIQSRANKAAKTSSSSLLSRPAKGLSQTEEERARPEASSFLLLSLRLSSKTLARGPLSLGTCAPLHLVIERRRASNKMRRRKGGKAKEDSKAHN